MERLPQSPGLKRRRRANGSYAWYWCADPRAIAAGYPVKTVNLTMLAAMPDVMIQRAERLELEQKLWLRQSKMPERKFDGTFKFLLELYQSDQKSTFNTSIKPGTRRVYTIYPRKLINHIGALSIAASDGRDVLEWFSEWRVGAGGKDQLPAARMALAVLEAAVSFGVVCRIAGVRDFQVTVPTCSCGCACSGTTELGESSMSETSILFAQNVRVKTPGEISFGSLFPASQKYIGVSFGRTFGCYPAP
jgi:hypothetical protein